MPTNSNRFDLAVQKLYTAFHQDRLNPEYCEQCAVGNILDHRNAWQYLTDVHGSLQLNYVGRVHQLLGRRFQGYTPMELLEIEGAFLKGCGYALPLKRGSLRPDNPKNKEVLFNGLCAIVSYLCLLDNRDDIMDYGSLFDFEPAFEALQ